jgi:hypothetical protein
MRGRQLRRLEKSDFSLYLLGNGALFWWLVLGFIGVDIDLDGEDRKRRVFKTIGASL